MMLDRQWRSRKEVAVQPATMCTPVDYSPQIINMNEKFKLDINIRTKKSQNNNKLLSEHPTAAAYVEV